MYRPKETRGSLVFQALASGLLSVIALLVSGQNAAISALAGGCIMLLAYFLSAWLVGFGVRKKSPAAFLALLLAAEMAKLFFVVIALLLVWLCFRNVNWLWEIMGCIAAIAAYGLTLLINSRRR